MDSKSTPQGATQNFLPRLQPREYWWFFVGEDASLAPHTRPKSAEASVPVSPPMPSEEDPEPNERFTYKTLGEKQKWVPFNTVDRDRLEQAYNNAPNSEEERLMVVCGLSGQRLWLANLEKMEMSPLYWKFGSQVALRRSIWMIMNHDDRMGGIPCPVAWEKILEIKYQEHIDWVTHSQDHPVEDGNPPELVVEPEGLLSKYMLVLKRGITTVATLIPKLPSSVQPRSLVKGILPASIPKPIRLIRGYPAYYGAVMSASSSPSLLTTQSPSSSSTSPPGKVPTVPPSPYDEPDFNIHPVKHLVFVVHGIGQKLADKLGYKFVSAINSLRRRTLDVAQAHGLALEDLVVVPIQWRVELDMGSGYFRDESGQEDENGDFDHMLNAITLPTIPGIRSFASDVTLDIMLYMTPRHLDRIVEACAKEIRRVYDLFKIWNPNANPKVSMIGHSLGAALVYDIIGVELGIEQTSVESVTAALYGIKARLGFDVETFFSLGSPLPFFLLLKHFRPVACSRINPQDLEDAIKEAKEINPISTEGAPAKLSFIGAKQLYNVFMPFDLVAHRMEPLIVPPGQRNFIQNPSPVPYCKGGVTGLKLGVVEKVTKTKLEFAQVVNRSVNSLPQWLKARLLSTDIQTITGETRSDDERQQSEVPAEKPRIRRPYPMQLLYNFNQNGRIDYVLQDSIMENAYLSSISSHFSYWSDEDISAFIVKQLFQLP